MGRRVADRVSFPRLVSVRSSLGDRWTAGGDPGTGVAVPTGRTVHPGDRVVFTCHGQDPHGDELLWWLHPFNQPRGHPVIGETVRLVWQVDEASIGERAYLGIGMAGLSINHRAGAASMDGYDGWLVFHYRVTPVAQPGIVVAGTATLSPRQWVE